MNPLKWLLKKLGLIKEKEAVQIKLIPKDHKTSTVSFPIHFKEYQLKIKRSPPKKIRGKFKPKTAHEKGCGNQTLSWRRKTN